MMKKSLVLSIISVLISFVSFALANDNAFTSKPEIQIVNGQKVRQDVPTHYLPPPSSIRDPGDILTSWPSSVAAWGLGFDGEYLWISEAANPNYVHQFDLDGNATGISHNLPLAGSWVGDMAFDNDGNMLVVNVGGDNNIYKIDPVNGTILDQLIGSWGISQRGLAYDPNSGDLFVGGWNDLTIYHIQGFEGDTPGAAINTVPVGYSISGLAYHPIGSTGEGTLWLAENANPEFVYELDPLNNFAVVNSFPAPGNGLGYNGAGMASDDMGDFWLVSLPLNTVYKMGGPIICTFGGVTGTITLTDANDHSGVVVTAGNRDATTDENGDYEIYDVVPGTYDVTAFILGYEYGLVEGVVVGEEVVQGIDFTLALIGGPPENLSATDDQETTVTVSWNEPTGENPLGYNLYRSATSGGSYTQLATDITGLSYVDDTVGGTLWYYVATALYVDGESFYSNEDEGSIDIAPAPPLNLDHSVSGNTVSLFWDDSPEGDVVGYNVYHRFGGVGDFELLIYVIESEYEYDVEDGVHYYYVTAVDAGDPALESDPSETIQSLIGFLPPTSASAASGLDGHVLVGWVPPGVFGNSYVEDFEADNGGYTEEGGGWEWGAPTSRPGGAYSGENVWGTNLTGDYVNNASWTLSSIPIIIAGWGPHLTYWAWYDIENSWDGWNVKISIDDGATWVIIDPVGGYPDDSIVGLGEPGFTGNSGGWVQHVFDLTGYENEVMFRWHFGTDSSVNTYPGVYIDDVYVGHLDVNLTYVDYEAPDFKTYLIQEYGVTNDAALIAKAEVSYQEILSRTEIPVINATPLTSIRDLIAYNIYRSTESGFEPDESNLAGSVDVPGIAEFDDWGPDLVNLPEGLEEGLANGTEYFFLVTTVYDDAGESAPSIEVSAIPANAPPTPPENFDASISNRVVTMTWDENVVDYDAMGYGVMRRIAIDAEFEQIAFVPYGTTTYEDDLTEADDGNYWYGLTTVDYYDEPSEMSDDVYIPVGGLPPTSAWADGGLDGHVLVYWGIGPCPFVEDFESDDGGYVADNNGPDGWEWGAPDYANGPYGAYSGENVWGTNLTGDYVNNASWTLSSIPIIIAGWEPHLTYWAWYDIENGWDGFNIKISIDDGATWTVIDPVGGYPDDSIVGLGEPGFTGTSDGWVQHVFDLAGYEGDVMFRWHFGSDGSVDWYPGVYIDDVFVGHLEVALTYVDYKTPDFETYLIQVYGATNDAAL
ncbi:MAG: hypothetical protein GY869_16950, partial [Planctomycetes bacterium]|nr:hypothetical protein [Planctomycetota bacterium]